MDADLGRQLGIADQGQHRPLGQLDPALDRGHRRPHGCGSRYRIPVDGHRCESRSRPQSPGAPGYHRLVATIDLQQSLENLKLERDAIVLYDALAGIEKDERRASGVPDDRRQRAAPCRDLGRQAARAGRDRAASRRSAAAGPADHRPGPDLRHPRGQRPRPGARGRRGGRLYRPGLTRGRGDRRRRARARRDLEAARRRSRPAGHRPMHRSAALRQVQAPRRQRARSAGTSAGTGPASRAPSGRSSSASPTASSATSRW